MTSRSAARKTARRAARRRPPGRGGGCLALPVPLAAGAAIWRAPPPWFAGARAPEAPCCDVL